MTTSKPRPAQTLAAWAWAAVGLTPAGWFYGLLAVAYSHLGDVTDVTAPGGHSIILKQSPPPGQRVTPGTVVTFEISR